MAVVCLYTAARWQRPPRAADPVRPPAPEAAALPVRAASMRPASRTVYPYSIIRGGAWSRAELVEALDRDAVAAAHYRGFRADDTRIEHLPAARAAYVSFRKNDRVYWTRHTVTLAAGEAVLSDGEHLARARCGNRISFTPQQPVGPDVDLDTPEESPATPAEGESRAPDVFHLPQLAREVFPPTAMRPADLATAAFAPSAPASPVGYPAWFGGGGGYAPMLQPNAPAPLPESSPTPAPAAPIPSATLPVGGIATAPPPAPPPVAGGVPVGSTTPGIGAATDGANSGHPITVANLLPPGNTRTTPAGSAGAPPLPPGTSGGDATPDGPGDTPPGPPVPTVSTPLDSPPGSPPDAPPGFPPGAPSTDTPEPAAIWLIAAGAGVIALRRAMR